MVLYLGTGYIYFSACSLSSINLNGHISPPLPYIDRGSAISAPEDKCPGQAELKLPTLHSFPLPRDLSGVFVGFLLLW